MSLCLLLSVHCFSSDTVPSPNIGFSPYIGRGVYIKPFGERFDPSQLPYFKYRQALAQLEDGESGSDQVG